VYAQLESAIETHKEHEAFRGLHEVLGEIARVRGINSAILYRFICTIIIGLVSLKADGIAKDLRFYLGEDWGNKYQPTQAVNDYVKCDAR